MYYSNNTYFCIQISLLRMDMFSKIQVGDLSHGISEKQVDTFHFTNEVELIRLEGYKLNMGGVPDVSIPLRLDAISLILTISGEASVEIDSKVYTLLPDTMMNLIGFKVLRNFIFSDDYIGYQIMVSNRFYNEAFQKERPLTPEAAMKKDACPLDKVSREETEYLVEIIREIIRIIGRTDHIWHRRMVVNEVRKFFMETGNMVIKRLDSLDREQNPPNNDMMHFKFMQLLHDNSTERKSVGYYADKLCVTPDYLAQTIKAFSGHTVSYWINETLLQQAKLYMLDSEKSIQQIADILNFSDQSAFGRFFKKNTGKSPAEYRRFLKSG